MSFIIPHQKYYRIQLLSQMAEDNLSPILALFPQHSVWKGIIPGTSFSGVKRALLDSEFHIGKALR